jgi:hypothetical protein
MRKAFRLATIMLLPLAAPNSAQALDLETTLKDVETKLKIAITRWNCKGHGHFMRPECRTDAGNQNQDMKTGTIISFKKIGEPEPVEIKRERIPNVAKGTTKGITEGVSFTHSIELEQNQSVNGGASIGIASIGTAIGQQLGIEIGHQVDRSVTITMDGNYCDTFEIVTRSIYQKGMLTAPGHNLMSTPVRVKLNVDMDAINLCEEKKDDKGKPEPARVAGRYRQGITLAVNAR